MESDPEESIHQVEEPEDSDPEEEIMGDNIKDPVLRVLSKPSI